MIKAYEITQRIIVDDDGIISSTTEDIKEVDLDDEDEEGEEISDKERATRRIAALMNSANVTLEEVVREYATLKEKKEEVE